MGDYQVAYSDNKYFFKLSGQLKYSTSTNFCAFLDKIYSENNYSDILVDLSDAEYLDSTNLGILAKLACHVLKKFHHKLTVVSTNNDVTDLLINIGFEKLCVLIRQPMEFEKDLNQINDLDDSQKNLAKVMLDAHKTLMEMNDKNRETFKDAVDLLKKEV